MDKLLKEAIADAKAVRETALANAKIALEEAFAPKLQSMLAAKINEEEDEMEDEEETTDEGTGMGIDYLGEKEYGEEEEMGEAKDEEEGESEEEESEEETDESLDLEAIIRELEMEAADSEENGEEEVEEAKEDEEEINLDELLAALSEEEGEDEEEMANEAKDEKDEDEKDEKNVDEINRLKSELAEYRDAVVFLKDKINEINLLNAKLLYTNKLFKSHSLTEAQKVKILESLDRTKTVREVKLVYSTLAESLTETSGKTKSKIAESFGFASKKSGNTQKAIIEEGTTLANRFQKLANINKKK